MRVLALDTASPAPALALLLEGGPDAGSLVELEELGSAAAESIPARLAQLLSRSGLPISSLERLAVLSGPGSFTGLRAGIAFARGLARALDVPLVSASTFRVAAAALPTRDADLLLDAGRGEVHRARLRSGTLTEDPALVPASAARDAAEREGVTTVRLDETRPLLAPSLARLASGKASSEPLSVLYGRPSAAEERWG